jgi:hypothetical protein
MSQAKDLTNIAARKVQCYNKTKYDDEKQYLKRVLFEFCKQIKPEAERTDEFDDAEVYFQGYHDGDEYNNSSEGKNSAEPSLTHALKIPSDDPSFKTCLSDFWNGALKRNAEVLRYKGRLRKGLTRTKLPIFTRT